MSLLFALDGDVDDLRIPPPGPPRRTDGLWEQTCFEAFVAPKDAPGYFEFNFAPSGAWAAYVFPRYRDGRALDLRWHPAISALRTADRFELDAVLHLDRLPGMLLNERLQCGLSAVIEDQHGARSYWALRHAPGKPDFHHPDAFAMELAPPIADLVHHPSSTGSQ